MDLLKKILVVVFGVIAILLVIGFFLPRQVSVERSVVIQADAEDIFPYVNSLKAFNEWSPWADRDPDTVYVFSGPEEGTGMRAEWTSEVDSVGSGAQVIVKSVENKLVRTSLDFGMEGLAEAEYRLETVDGGTEVTWGFKTDMGANPVSRYMGLMMDKWVGGDYERGLQNLKTLVEARTA